MKTLGMFASLGLGITMMLSNGMGLIQTVMASVLITMGTLLMEEII